MPDEVKRALEIPGSLRYLTCSELHKVLDTSYNRAPYVYVYIYIHVYVYIYIYMYINTHEI